MTATLRGAALAALVAFAGACRTAAPPATAISTAQFEDVPAPRGATYLEGEGNSFSYRTPTFRCGVFHYDWQGPEADVIRFYRETMTMPPYSWSFTGEDRASEGSARLHFAKGDDVCLVDIDRVPKPGIAKKNNLALVVRVNCNK